MNKVLDKAEPSVIVLMPTFNHEKFIAQAIESVLAQVTNFDVHLCIFDDASTDRTFDIASSFDNRNRVNVSLVRNEINLGAFENGAKLRSKALDSGCKYVAILEGDDFWIDSQKLQTQVEVLELSQEFILSGHLSWILVDNDRISDRFIAGVFDIKHIIKNSRVCHTASMLFRNTFDKADLNFINSFLLNKEFLAGDVLLNLLLMRGGRAHVSPSYMSVYRKHAGGISSDNAFKAESLLSYFDMLEAFNAYTNCNFAKSISEKQLELLEHTVIKDTRINSKLNAVKRAFGIRFFSGVKLSIIMPFNTLKALLYRGFRLNSGVK